MITTMEEKKAFVQKFNIFDDTFFEVVAKDKAAVEDILRIILHDAGLLVAQLFPQGSIKNLYGRSVRLDALCITGDGRVINVEIQKGDNDNHVKRVRYNASCITANVTEPGELFENINDVYIVYISKFDVFRRKRRLYYVERGFHDKNEAVPVGDGEHIIYVNACDDVETEDTDVAELMRFFNHSQGQNEKFRRLANRVYELKNNDVEVMTLCKLVEDYAKEYAKEYAKDCTQKGKETIICELVRDGALSAEIGAGKLNISISELYEMMNEFGYQAPESM